MYQTRRIDDEDGPRGLYDDEKSDIATLQRTKRFVARVAERLKAAKLQSVIGGRLEYTPDGIGIDLDGYQEMMDDAIRRIEMQPAEEWEREQDDIACGEHTLNYDPQIEDGWRFA